MSTVIRAELSHKSKYHMTPNTEIAAVNGSGV